MNVRVHLDKIEFRSSSGIQIWLEHLHAFRFLGYNDIYPYEASLCKCKLKIDFEVLFG